MFLYIFVVSAFGLAGYLLGCVYNYAVLQQSKYFRFVYNYATLQQSKIVNA